MKSVYCFLILVGLTSNTFAQEQVCKVLYPHVIVKDASNTSEILNFLNLEYKDEFGISTFVITAKTESPAAYHYLFQQQILSIPIYHADIKVNVTKQGKIISVYSNLADLSSLPKLAAFPSVTIDALTENWLSENNSINYTEKSYCYIPTTSSLTPAIKIKYKDNYSIVHEVIIDQTGLTQTHVTSVFFGQDSLVTGKVFNPDPLTSANVGYGGAYQDSSDADIVVLNNQRQTKSFKASFDGTTFSLKNQYIELRDNNGDAILPVTSTSPVFDFTRHQSGFEDVNAFFHLSLQSDYIRSLGFNATSQLVYPDPHGGTADNSFFNEPNTIYFGTGGVDDAEDADVLIHEYTHFVSYTAAPSTNSGLERNSIDEGTCDYFAASYSKAISSYNSTKLFNWDGNPPFWNGRVVNTTKHYPQNVSNNIYKDGEMWSATLMQIHDELGKATTDSLVLQTMYLFASNMTYPQVAQALLTADTLLTGGNNFCVLYKYLFNRGYLPLMANPCGINGIDNVQRIPIQLLQNPNGFSIESTEKEVHINGYMLIDAVGNSIYKDNTTRFDKRDNFSQGLYFVQVETNLGNKTFKVIF
jgi:Zn-dependent metalloprotease